MEKEVADFMFRIVNTVEKMSGRFPLGHPYYFGHPYYLRKYTQELGHLLCGEVKHVVRNGVPRRVRDDVKKRMNQSDLRQVVHYFRIWFRDLPHYDFWVVIFGMRRGSCSYYPVTLAYKHSTLIDDFCGRFLV